MPTDVALAFARKANAERQAAKDYTICLIVVCLSVVVGLALAVLMFRFGFNVKAVLELVAAG